MKVKTVERCLNYSGQIGMQKTPWENGLKKTRRWRHQEVNGERVSSSPTI